MLDDCDIFVVKFYSSHHYLCFWTSKLNLTFSVFLSNFQDIILTPDISFEKNCNNIAHTCYFFYFQKAN